MALRTIDRQLGCGSTAAGCVRTAIAVTTVPHVAGNGRALRAAPCIGQAVRAPYHAVLGAAAAASCCLSWSPALLHAAGAQRAAGRAAARGAAGHGHVQGGGCGRCRGAEFRQAP
jgi:hypothetical protein